ncbi:cytochrome P450 [Mycena rebaudengoi]|nr:cytochrome P450 [Mycena rebaudengoi]
MPLIYILSFFVTVFLYIFFRALVASRFSGLRDLPGPPVQKWFGNHLRHVLNPTVTPFVHEIFVQYYGRTVRIRGLGPWDERLLTLDPLSVSHILQNTAIYVKPWQSRRAITNLIGCGMLSAEGQVHKRQRRVALPAFSAQNMRSLVDISFKKGIQLRDAWVDLLGSETESTSVRIDVYQFLSRVTFDVMGLAGFDYNFNSVQDETNELLIAYKDMFEVAISQSTMFRKLLSIYLPTINQLFPDTTVRTVQRCQAVIHRVAGRLIHEKKQKIAEGEKSGFHSAFWPFLPLKAMTVKSNTAADLPPEQRISDDDILNNINTFMFAGSDTSSLTLTWTLLLLAQNVGIQDRLRTELLSVAQEFPRDLSELSEDQIQSLHSALSGLPFLHNVTRESLRLIPPLHSTARVATQNNEGTNITKHSFIVPKGTFVHLSIEAFNLDKAFWGEDAWEFKPDRWDSLPEAVQQYPWHFSNILTFSTGPRACPGFRFTLIEIKTLYYILLTNFVFRETKDKIAKQNVVLTRPYISGKFKDGTQCPLLVSRFSAK